VDRPGLGVKVWQACRHLPRHVPTSGPCLGRKDAITRFRRKGFENLLKWFPRTAGARRALHIGYRLSKRQLIVRSFVLVLAVSLGGCAAAHVAIENLPDPPVTEDLSEPDYRRIVADNIASIFPKPEPLGTLEISGVWRTNHFKGPVWTTCLRIHADHAPQEYAIFIQDGRIIDHRAGVALDRCKQQAYQSFEPSNFIQQKKAGR
jgi:hypothetical protein